MITTRDLGFVVVSCTTFQYFWAADSTSPASLASYCHYYQKPEPTPPDPTSWVVTSIAIFLPEALWHLTLMIIKAECINAIVSSTCSSSSQSSSSSSSQTDYISNLPSLALISIYGFIYFVCWFNWSVCSAILVIYCFGLIIAIVLLLEIKFITICIY